MRLPRIKGQGTSFYHCISRVVDGRFIFNDLEKEYFMSLLRSLEGFHGIRVVAYCVMSNHFHLILEEPDREALPPLDRETLFERMGFLYDKQTICSVRKELDRAAKGGNERWEQEILARFSNRMGDLSVFMKELKQRFSSWYNRNNNRRGTLWEERFKSLLVEGDKKALLTVAAYIELNPVRAGIVEEVESYRWCSYAAAVAGDELAREGILRIWGQSPAVSAGEEEQSWSEAGAHYRLWLYGEGREVRGGESGEEVLRKGFSEEAVAAEVAKGGKLTREEALRFKVRYFSDGVVLGSATYVNEVHKNYRKWFGRSRETGAREMKGAEWENLCSMRDLRRDCIVGIGRQDLGGV